jgi:hypothetical protein
MLSVHEDTPAEHCGSMDADDNGVISDVEFEMQHMGPENSVDNLHHRAQEMNPCVTSKVEYMGKVRRQSL